MPTEPTSTETDLDTVILADRLGEELAPLDDFDCPALLPIAGKAVVEHCLEDLWEAGVREATIAFPETHPHFPQRVGDGSRFGMRLRYMSTRGEAWPSEVRSMGWADRAAVWSRMSSFSATAFRSTAGSTLPILGDKRAFVLSHARDLVIFKIVGYAEQVVKYYGLTDMRAKIWIAHQRYPTKGRVWHPAGAHPFIGMNEALVHNGVANYFGVTEYLRQRNLVPHF